MITTEQTPHQTETPQTEHAKSREKLQHEHLRREFAAVALLAILIATYQKPENDHLFEPLPPQKEPTHDYASNRAEIFSLIYHAFATRDQQTSHQPEFGRSDDDYIHTPGHSEDYVSQFRDSVFYRTPPSTAHPNPRAFQPEFRPAPSLADTELGPQLPNLAFNDRIRPSDTGSKQPTEADFEAADRANEMYQRALFDKGWRGGEATEDQQKKAERGMLREYHPDLPTTSPQDAEAIKMFNAGRAKPVTKPGSSSAPSSQ